MTPPAALAVTGGILFFLAALCAAVADDAPRRTAGRYTAAAWVLTVTAASCWAGAAWWSTSWP